MSSSIRWESDPGLAGSMSRVQERPIMLDFYNPG
jgi:hypothetical protein